MSKKNEKVVDTKAEENQTVIISGKVGEKSFEDMKKMIAEFNLMKKAIKETTKDLSKEEKKNLGIGIKEKREIPESLLDMTTDIFKAINANLDNLKNEFVTTVTLEKPDGNKSISLTQLNSVYTVAIIRRSEKKEKK